MVFTRFAQRFVPPVRSIVRASGATLLLLISSCGGAVTTTTYELECETGTLGCSCYGNWSCNYQLSCVEEVCIDRRDKPAVEGKELALSASLPDPLAAATNDSCLQCLQDDCAKELEACYPETGCIALQACWLECSNAPDATTETCATRCANQASVSARSKSASVTECSQHRCAACQSSATN